MRTIFYLSALFSAILIFLGYHPEYITGPGISGNPLFVTPDDQFSRQGLVTNLGGIFVFLFYFFKFSKWAYPDEAPPGFHPKPTRHFTTWLRYLGWSGIYGFFMVICYALILLFPSFFVNFFGIYSQFSPLDTGFLKTMVTGVRNDPSTFVPYAVILLTFVWSGTFSERERALRYNLQKNALIPIEANRLIRQYFDHIDQFKPDPMEMKKVIEGIPYSLVNDFAAGNKGKGELEHKYIQCEYLIHQVEMLRANRLFAKTLSRYSEDLHEAESRLNSLRVKLQTYKMEMLESLTSSSGVPDKHLLDLHGLKLAWEDATTSQAFERRYFRNTRARISEELSQCMKFVLGIVICIVLAVGKSRQNRHALLENFGLLPPKYSGPVFNREFTVRILLGVICTTLICSVAYYSIEQGISGLSAPPLLIHPPVPAIDSGHEILVWSLYAVCMHLLGVMGGYYVQQWLSEERRAMGNRDSGQFIFSDYLFCGVFGFCLNVFLFAILFFPQGRLEEFQMAWPWAFVTAATALFTGIYMTRKKRMSRLKCLPLMGFQGAVTSLFSAAVLYYLYDEALYNLQNIHPLLRAFGMYTLVTAFFTGVAISFVLLCWIRRQNNEYWGSKENPAVPENNQGGNL